MQMNYRWEAVWAKLHEADISLQIQLGECIGGLAQGEMHLLAGSQKVLTPGDFRVGDDTPAMPPKVVLLKSCHAF